MSDANGQRSLVELYDRQVYLSHLQARALYEALGRGLINLSRVAAKAQDQAGKENSVVEESGDTS